MNKKMDSSSKEKVTAKGKDIKESKDLTASVAKGMTKATSKEKTIHTNDKTPTGKVKGDNTKTLSLTGKNTNDLKNITNTLGTTSKSKLGGTLSSEKNKEKNKSQNQTKANKSPQIDGKQNKTKLSKKDVKPLVKEDPEVIQKRQEQALLYDKFIKHSGLPVAFQIIFSELISKHIQPENFFTYTAMRLRQIGKEVEDIRGCAISVGEGKNKKADKNSI